MDYRFNHGSLRDLRSIVGVRNASRDQLTRQLALRSIPVISAAVDVGRLLRNYDLLFQYYTLLAFSSIMFVVSGENINLRPHS